MGRCDDAGVLFALIIASPTCRQGAGERGAVRVSDGRCPLQSSSRTNGCYIMRSVFISSTGKRSAEISTATVFPVFCHQCDVPRASEDASPALCTIGTAQVLAYSVTSPVTM